MVERKTLESRVLTEFVFDNIASSFIVKNFTSSHILVEPDVFEACDAYKIPSMTAQKIKARTNKILVKSAEAGEVEIDA